MCFGFSLAREWLPAPFYGAVFGFDGAIVDLMENVKQRKHNFKMVSQPSRMAA